MSTRRRFLSHSGRTLAAWAALGRAHLARAAEPGAAGKLEVLSRVARLMFPHDGLDDDVYRGLVGELLERENLYPLLSAGASSLDNFLALEEARQLEKLELIQDGEFFTEMASELKLVLYNSEALWNLVGYPGPSFPVGYAERGFDDIDWLPGT